MRKNDIRNYGTAAQRTAIPPGPRRPDIRQYVEKTSRKKQRNEWLQEEDDPVAFLDEQAAENDEWDEPEDMDSEQYDSGGSDERGSSPEPVPEAFARGPPEASEYAISSLDADQRPVVPDGWVDTARAGNAEVIEAAKKSAPEYGLEIVRVTYPFGEGHKLVASQSFREGEKIAPYRGVRMTGVEADALPNNYDKIVPMSDKEHVIVGDIQNPRFPSIGAYADDPGYEHNPQIQRSVRDDPTKITGNGFFQEQADGSMWVIAQSNISPGQDITINYGDDYWIDSGPEIARSYFKTERFYQEKLRNRNKRK